MVLLICSVLAFAPCPPASAASRNAVLGVAESQWQTDLKTVGGDYSFSDAFLDEVRTSQKDLERKYGAEHFEKLNARQETASARRRNNPLLHRKPVQARSSFILDLGLEKKEYNQLLHYIPILGSYYGEHHIAQILPYLAFCLNYDVQTSEIDFYIKEFLHRQTPPDIVCERLYQLAEGTLD